MNPEDLKEIQQSLNTKNIEEVQPQEPLVNKSIIEDPWSGSYVPSSEIKIISGEETKPILMLPPPKEEPTAPPMQVEPEKLDIPQVKEKTKKSYDISPINLPKKLPTELRKKFSEVGKQLDGISRELSAQTILLRRRKFKIRKLSEQLSAVEELIQNQLENYREAIDDLETQKRITEGYSSPIGPQPMESSTPWAPAGPEEVGNEQGYTPRLPSTKLSQGGFLNSGYPVAFSNGAYPSTPIPGLASGGIVVGSIDASKIIQPGIYDNPTVGYLPSGYAVIPENRNTGKNILNLYDYQQYQQSLIEALSLPLKAAVAGTAAKLGETVRGLGAFAPFFSGSLDNLINTLASLLGVTRQEASQILGGHENYREEFVGLWPSIMKLKDWIFGGGSAAGAGGGPGGGYEGEVFSGVAFIKNAGDLAYASGTNVGQLPAWIPIPQSFAKKVGYTSGFGFRWYKQHQGIDLDGTKDIPIISPFAGKISDVGTEPNPSGYGNYVEIQHDQPKIFTFYGHLDKIAAGIRKGAPVQPGQELGKMGTTGRSTGVHLHWEIRESSWGKRIDPVKFTHSIRAGGSPKPPSRNVMDYPEYEVSGVYDEGQIVRFGRPNPKLYKIKNGNIDYSSEGKFESGGTITVDNKTYITNNSRLLPDSQQEFKIKPFDSPSNSIVSLPANKPAKYIERVSEDFELSPIKMGQFMIPTNVYEYVQPIFNSIQSIAAPPKKPVDIQRPVRPEITTTDLKSDKPEIYTKVQQYQIPSTPTPAPAKKSSRIITTNIPTAAVKKCMHERRL